MIKKILNHINILILILLATWISFSNYNTLNSINKKIINISNKNNLILTKNWYNFTNVKIKNFYNSIWIEKSLKDIIIEKNKLIKKYWIWYFYLIMWFLETETWISNRTNKNSYLLWKYFNLDLCSNWTYKKYETKYKKSSYFRRTKLWQNIAICNLIKKISKNNKNYNQIKNFFYNLKTSYAWAISVSQIMPVNFELLIKNSPVNFDTFKNFSFYFKLTSKFAFLENNFYKNNKFKEININLLKDCYYNTIKNYNDKLICNQIKNWIFKYNHSDVYVKTVLINSIKLYYLDKLWIYSNFMISKNSFVILSKFKNKLKKWLLVLNNNKKDKTLIIYNWRYNANCYLILKNKNPNLNFNWYWNTIICIDKFLNVYQYSKINNFLTYKFITKNKKYYWINNINLDYKKNKNIIYYILQKITWNWINWKIKNIIKLKDISPWQIIWIIWNSNWQLNDRIYFNIYNLKLNISNWFYQSIQSDIKWIINSTISLIN